MTHLPHPPADLTRHLQEEINNRSQNGGGRVTIPPGRWICGSLQLKSGVELHLSQGAILRASDDPGLYTPVAENVPEITANPKTCAFLWASKEDHILISGSGRLDGGGDADACPDWIAAQDMFRPAVLFMNACKGIQIQGIKIVGSKWWTLHLHNCDDIRLSGITMDNTWPNSDGIDPDGCRNVIISDCTLRCGDDCIVFKSTKGHANENATITNCILETNHACFKLGTESFGAFRNIVVSNCVMRGNVAFGLYMKDGGIMENIRATNLVVDTQSAWPVLIDAMPRYHLSGKPAGRIRNVSINQSSFNGPGRIWLEGPEDAPLENIRLQDIDWNITGSIPKPALAKPTGSARTSIDLDRPSYELSPAHILAIRINGLNLSGIQFSGPESTRPLLRKF